MRKKLNTRAKTFRIRNRRKGEEGRSDAQYQWAKGLVSDLWHELVVEWTQQHTARIRAVGAGNSFLDYLISNPSVTAVPDEFFRRTYSNPAPLSKWQKLQANVDRLASTLHAFFHWVTHTRLSVLDEHGRRMPKPEHWNPVEKKKEVYAHSETVRNVLPSYLVRELLQLLTENDWAWARKAAPDMHKFKSGGVELEVWSPVRASALALLLLLPLRSFQVRMLESGEGDPEVYRAGQWIANCGPHAQPDAKCRGALRAIRNPTLGVTTTGFFVNTNKSADRLPDESEAGYVIPWENIQAIQIIENLRDWQETYNPVKESLLWTSIDEPKLRLATKPRPDGAFFLFRDPVGMIENQPLSYGRLEYLWAKLLTALEARLAERGQRLPSGELIQLTTEHPDRRVRQPVFDLYSLRPSQITTLANEGEVPLHILSRCIAGHASALMTLYYIKDTGQTNECLAKASMKIDGASQKVFAQFLRSMDRTPAGFVSNDAAGVAALDSQPEASWVHMPHGLCPVGGKACDRGGPPLPGNGRRHGPVPGGNQNCARCRFFISGPAFLPGIVNQFNLASTRLERATADQEMAQAACQELDNARFDMEQAGELFDAALVAREQGRLEAAELRVATLGANMEALAWLAARCQAVGASVPTSGLNLVLGGTMSDLRAIVSEVSNFELLDAVCQAATIHPTSEELEIAGRRNQELDRLLVRHGRVPRLLVLAPEEALRAGNEMMRLLVAQYGIDAIVSLLSGSDIGLQAAIADQLEGMVDRCVRTGAIGKGAAAALPSATEEAV